METKAIESPLSLVTWGAITPEDAPSAAGTYMVINTKTGCAYFGQSEDVCRRLKAHRSNLRSGIHANALLQASWNADGESAFAYCVLHINESDEVPFNYEGYYIDQYLGTFSLNCNTRERSKIRDRAASRWKEWLRTQLDAIKATPTPGKR